MVLGLETDPPFPIQVRRNTGFAVVGPETPPALHRVPGSWPFMIVARDVNTANVETVVGFLCPETSMDEGTGLGTSVGVLVFFQSVWVVDVIVL